MQVYTKVVLVRIIGKPHALFFDVERHKNAFFNFYDSVIVKKTISKLIKYGIPLLVGVVLIYVLYKNVDMSKTVGILKIRINW